MSESLKSRREFIKKGALATGGLMGLPLISGESGLKQAKTGNYLPKLSELKKPLAIAMWDYSWLLRHHKYGSFEDWNKVLNELVERGYNAIRIDCMPQFVAAGNDGKLQEEFFHKREVWKPAYWGNQFSMYSRPREALLEFMKKCEQKAVRVGLATWFMGHGTERNLEFKGIDGFVRAWDETLEFLKQNDLLKNVIYVDLLNEYPLWHGFEWFKKEMNLRGNEKLFRENNPDANVPDEVFQKRKGKGYTILQQEFYQGFIDTVISTLKKKWPQLTFFTSQTGGGGEGALWKQIDFKNFGAIDAHFWFTQNSEFTSKTAVAGLNMFRTQKDSGFKEGYENALKYWRKNEQKLAGWMEEKIKYVGDLGKKYSIPIGNTEGWGAVFWQDHPLLGWEFIKEAADVAVDISLKHGYKFICTSNFTHPQFEGIWRDLAWHRQITERIKKA